MPRTSPAACSRLIFGTNASSTEVRNTTTSGSNTAATENAAKLCRANSIAAIHWSACKRSVYSALARPNGAICRNWSANALRSNHGAPKPWWRRT